MKKSKKIPKRRCKICKKWYEPDPRTQAHQTCCSDETCQKERKSRYDKGWHKRNPDYEELRRLYRQGWAKQYPDYWQQYRQENPEYCAKDNKRRSKSRKQAKTAAKQVLIDRRVDELVKHLLWKESAAKQVDIAIPP